MTLNEDILGKIRSLRDGKKKGLILSSSLLVLISFFYFFVVGSSLHAVIYSFLHRVTYEEIFVTRVTSLSADAFILLLASIIWIWVSIKVEYLKYAISIFFSVFLLSLFLNMTTITVAGAVSTLPVVSCLIILNRFWDKSIISHDFSLSIDYMTLTGIGLACLGIICLVVFIPTGIKTVNVDIFPYAIFQQLLAILTPILMSALVFCLPLKAILTQVASRINGRNNVLVTINFEGKLSTKRISVCLSLSILLAIAVALIPHLLIINPNNERLGVDTPRYVTWLMHLKNQSADPMIFAIKTLADRPLTIIILFLMTEVTNASPFQIIEYSPALFASLLTLATFFLTRQLTGNDKIAVIASLLSAISFQTLIGIYSGFYANWLALILGYSAFGLLVGCLKRPSKMGLVALGLLMLGVLLAHTYTWTILISVAFVFLIVLHRLNYYPRKHFLLLYLVLSTSIAVDVLKSSWTASSTRLEADVSSRLGQGLGISQFSNRLVTLAETVQTYYGGTYANIAILGLVMYWLVISNLREPVNIFIVIFLSTALIPLFIGDYLLLSRVLYDIPFQIPAAISLYYIGAKKSKMISIALLLITGYLSLHVLANLGYVPPP